MAILEVRNLCKAFPGVQALSDVSVAFQEGSCHALVGENGAGKSTLGKIISGIYEPDSGTIIYEGKPVEFRNPRDAVMAGIGVVHQELAFCENMTVGENLCLGDLPKKGMWFDREAVKARSKEWLRVIEADIDPDSNLGSLPVSKQQLVQIAGAIGQGAKVLIFDEPTSSLSQREASKLLDLINGLKAKGITCIYVSHRMEEIFAICDDLTVLRDGHLVDTVPAQTTSRSELIKMMVGREVLDTNLSTLSGGNTVLAVSGLSSPGRLEDVSFELKEGEVLGLGGLVGAGRTEVAEAIFGIDEQATGELTLHGKPYHPSSPVWAMENGIGLVPEDRKRQGLVLSMSVLDNVTLPNLDQVSRFTWIRKSDEKKLADEFCTKMRVKTPSYAAGSAGLSGGNQQKLVIAKWLAHNCDILIVDEPTRGVDVGAKAEIHELIINLAKDGKSVILISSELPELLALSTRILVMKDGKVAGTLKREEATEQMVMGLMAGVS